MTDIDFAALAERGADAWNQWRAQHPDSQPDLSRAYLYSFDLSGFNLREVSLERACLIGANLQSADLRGACLEGVYANGSNFSRADLTGADLRQGGFSKSNFESTNFSGAIAQGAEFAGANFTGACLAAWQIDAATSLNDVQGSHVYVDLPPSGRSPKTGFFGPGELALFLQRRQGKSALQVTAATENPVATIAAALTTIFTVCRWQLIRFWQQGLSAGQRGWRSCQQACVKLFTGQLPALCQRSLHLYGYWHTRISQQRRRAVQVSRDRHKLLQLDWDAFLQGDRPVQQKLSRRHQQLRVRFNRTSRWLRVGVYRCLQQLYAIALTVYPLCRQKAAFAHQQTNRFIQRLSRLSFTHWRPPSRRRARWSTRKRQNYRFTHFKLTRMSRRPKRRFQRSRQRWRRGGFFSLSKRSAVSRNIGRGNWPDDERLAKHRFDYRKAKPNRFTNRQESQESTVDRPPSQTDLG